jgi:hypothetical protein
LRFEAGHDAIHLSATAWADVVSLKDESVVERKIADSGDAKNSRQFVEIEIATADHPNDMKLNPGCGSGRLSGMRDSILHQAQAEAVRTRSFAVGTEHLLLALLADSRSAALDVLRELGVPLERIRQEVEWSLPPSDSAPPPGRLPSTPAADQALAGAADPVSLLAALSRSADPAGQILRKLGVTPDAVRETLDSGDR